MSVEQSGPIDYATPTPTAAPGPTVCLILCGGLGLFFAVIGVLGLVANSGLLLASWYFNQPLPEHVRTERMWVLAGCAATTAAGIWLLRLRLRKRGAK